MEQLDVSKYQPMIDAILGVADLEKITVKKIRNALSELFSTDLTPHKKQMNDFILQRYYTLADELDKENQDKAQRREDGDRKLAQRLQSESSRPSRAKAPKAKKAKSSGTRRTPNTAFNAELAVSEALQAVVGQPHMSRPMVVKRLWEYIKEHQLQNPDDKRRITCDEALEAVFKKSSVGMFEMNRLLGSHLFKEEDLAAPKSAKSEDSDSD